MVPGLAHYLTVAAVLFTLGIFGIFLNRKNVIIIMMSIELMLLAININFVAFSVALNDLAGQVFAMFVLTVAAAEAAIGLAIFVVYSATRLDPGRGHSHDAGLIDGYRRRLSTAARRHHRRLFWPADRRSRGAARHLRRDAAIRGYRDPDVHWHPRAPRRAGCAAGHLDRAPAGSISNGPCGSTRCPA